MFTLSEPTGLSIDLNHTVRTLKTLETFRVGTVSRCKHVLNAESRTASHEWLEGLRSICSSKVESYDYNQYTHGGNLKEKGFKHVSQIRGL
jgi:hypothetical protein